MARMFLANRYRQHVNRLFVIMSALFCAFPIDTLGRDTLRVAVEVSVIAHDSGSEAILKSCIQNQLRALPNVIVVPPNEGNFRITLVIARSIRTNNQIAAAAAFSYLTHRIAISYASEGNRISPIADAAALLLAYNKAGSSDFLEALVDLIIATGTADYVCRSIVSAFDTSVIEFLRTSTSKQKRH